MERWRDPSTVEFRTLEYLRGLFITAGMDAPAMQMFQIPYLAADLVGQSFPEGGDRARLIAHIENSVEGDRLKMDAHKTAEGVRIAYPSVVLSAVRPA
jgi:hypothetical protein